MSKKKDKIKISFIGNNSVDVTGSQILVQTQNKNILLECGMIQSNSLLDDFKNNSKSFSFRPQNIDYVFLNHIHIDHSGLVGKLIRDGFQGKIIATSITKKLIKPMLLDSAKIIERDSEYITKKRGKQVYPYYTNDDVYNAIALTEEYGYDEIFELDDEISFKFLHNSHIIGASQLELFIKNESGFVSKILYTSDLGNPKIKNYFTGDLEKCKTANIVISECTYGSSDKNIKQDRNKDLEKIRTTVEQVCNVQKGRILIPSFSLARAQQILVDLYLLYKDDKSFTTSVILDSPLIWEITKIYKEVLTGEDLELFENACNWKNVRFIKDYNESKLCIKDTSPKIVLSSSGFLSKGRSVQYLTEYIKHTKDCVISIGYCPPNSVGGKIKSEQKNITIDGITYKNKCGIVVLNSYSSHIQQKELLNYLKGINCDKVYLVHADEKSKLEMKELLEKEYEKINRTTRVIVTQKGTIVTL